MVCVYSDDCCVYVCVYSSSIIAKFVITVITAIITNHCHKNHRDDEILRLGLLRVTEGLCLHSELVECASSSLLPVLDFHQTQAGLDSGGGT